MQNFVELNMKTIFDPTTVKFGVWGLKTSFRQFGSKYQKTSKAKSPEPYFHSSQARPNFNQNFKMNPINLSKAKICLHLRVGGLTLFGSIWPKILKSCKEKVAFLTKKFKKKKFKKP